MKYNIDWVKQKHDEAERLKYIFFWGNQPLKNGQIGKSCMSQWWDLHPFTVEQITYQTAEHWMMAGKAILFNDEEILEKILLAKTAAEAKKLGRQVRGFRHDIWVENRYEIVKQGNWHKYSQHEDLKTYLLNTKERILVEASPYDAIWGIGLKADAPNIENPNTWKGINLLGFALMEVRDELKTS